MDNVINFSRKLEVPDTAHTRAIRLKKEQIKVSSSQGEIALGIPHTAYTKTRGNVAFKNN